MNEWKQVSAGFEDYSSPSARPIPVGIFTALIRQEGERGGGGGGADTMSCIAFVSITIAQRKAVAESGWLCHSCGPAQTSLTMAEDFQYDVFLSHSAKDKAVVRAVAKRLRRRAEGLMGAQGGREHRDEDR